MTTKKPEKDAIEFDIAKGKLIKGKASELRVRDFASFISDEPPERGGNNLGPSPLEYVLAALCA